MFVCFSSGLPNEANDIDAEKENLNLEDISSKTNLIESESERISALEKDDSKDKDKLNQDKFSSKFKVCSLFFIA